MLQPLRQPFTEQLEDISQKNWSRPEDRHEALISFWRDIYCIVIEEVFEEHWTGKNSGEKEQVTEITGGESFPKEVDYKEPSSITAAWNLFHSILGKLFTRCRVSSLLKVDSRKRWFLGRILEISEGTVVD